MADQKPTSTFYNLLGGVNLKASEYSVQKSQFLDIRNMDFDVPNALQKRPGSTQAIGANTSGPINSLFEYIRLDGSSYVIAGSNSAMFYLTGTSLTVLDPSWSNGQPTDMLTFVNRLWLANGQNFKSWSAPGSTLASVGMPCARTQIEKSIFSGGASGFLVGGATAITVAASFISRGVFMAYGYVRTDGYVGPIDFSSARNTAAGTPNTVGAEFYNDGALSGNVWNFSTIPNVGISAIAIYIGVDTINQSSPIENVPGFGAVRVGNLGFQVTSGAYRLMGYSLKPNFDQSRFHLFTLLGAADLFTLTVGVTTVFGISFRPTFSDYDSVATGNAAFSGVPFCWFDTNTPKYIEQTNNVMLMAGFSNTPSTVWFSELGDPENLQADYNFEVRTNDGDRITALRTYNNNTIVLKEQSFHKIIGDSPDNYELVELSTEYGCISNQAVVEYKEKLLWLDRKGIVEYNGASWDIISTAVEDIFRRMNLSAAREKAVAVHHLYRNQIWWGIPIDGSSVNNFTVVFDYFVGAWTFFDGFNPASFGFIKGALTQPTVWRGDYSGMIYYHSASFYGDNGVGISCVATPHWEKNKENETWIWRRFFLDVATASGLTGTITGRVYSNYNLSSVQATFSMFQDAFQSRAEIGVVGKAATVEWSHFSASLPLLINGYSWAKRFLRNV